ncbi:MAG: histidine triad nucleotide-binding protein [Anaerolineae bacterium]|nr:histidine triad nucleotide-binding protein [Anaerolineae bacterium]
MSDSVFTRIINGELPAEFVYKDDLVVAIRDINPVAPFHVLIIPRKPLVNAYDFEDEENSRIAGHMMYVAARIAQQEGLKNGFRLIMNNGRDARQEVFHAHLHLLAGDDLGPMFCK